MPRVSYLLAGYASREQLRKVGGSGGLPGLCPRGSPLRVALAARAWAGGSSARGGGNGRWRRALQPTDGTGRAHGTGQPGWPKGGWLTRNICPSAAGGKPPSPPPPHALRRPALPGGPPPDPLFAQEPPMLIPLPPLLTASRPPLHPHRPRFLPSHTHLLPAAPQPPLPSNPIPRPSADGNQLGPHPPSAPPTQPNASRLTHPVEHAGCCGSQSAASTYRCPRLSTASIRNPLRLACCLLPHPPVTQPG